jgi:hypothetical protein
MATRYSINNALIKKIPTNKKTVYQPDANEYQPYNNEQYAYTFTIKVILVHFNILRIKSGMADIIIKK